MNFLEKLDFLLKRDNKTRSDLAHGTGIPRSTIDNWFNRQEKDPKRSNLVAIAKYFDVSLYYLCNDEYTDPIPALKDPEIIDFNNLGTIGLHFEGKITDLTEEEKQEIMNFVEYVFSKKQKKEI